VTGPGLTLTGTRPLHWHCRRRPVPAFSSRIGTGARAESRHFKAKLTTSRASGSCARPGQAAGPSPGSTGSLSRARASLSSANRRARVGAIGPAAASDCGRAHTVGSSQLEIAHSAPIRYAVHYRSEGKLRSPRSNGLASWVSTRGCIALLRAAHAARSPSQGYASKSARSLSIPTASSQERQRS
jgi:hypothetical protein